MRCLTVLFCAVSFAFAQGTAPKSMFEDYPAHAAVGNIGLGAEFMVHSFSRGEQMFIAPDYLVVEVALFPGKGEIVVVEPGKFSLRVNGKKSVLLAQAPAIAA